MDSDDSLSDNEDDRSMQEQLGDVAKILFEFNLKTSLKSLVKEHDVSNYYVTKKVGENACTCDFKGKCAVDSITAKKYYKDYSKLYNFADSAPSEYRQELSMLLFPVLSRVYIKFLEVNNREGRNHALKLCRLYRPDNGYFPEDALSDLMAMNRIDVVEEKFSQTKYDMSIEVFNYLQRCFRVPSIITDIITNDLRLQIYIGSASFDPKLQVNVVRQINSKHMSFGLNYASILRGELYYAIAEEAPTKRKRTRRSIALPRWNENAPTSDRIPLPNTPHALSVVGFPKPDDAKKHTALSRDVLPSVCCYSVLNVKDEITCAEISEEGLMLAVGFRSASIRVWSLSPWKLRRIKTFAELKSLDREPPAVFSIILDERSGNTYRSLNGHLDCVYSVSFSPDQNSLVSCSADHSVRLWSLLNWKCVGYFRSHVAPVWNVHFSAHGYYFASCAFDRTARIWATDSVKPLRVFLGHLSDVDCVLIHPNSNYVATGSSDCTVRIWDMLDAKCVRILVGHKSTVYVLKFSNCGSFLLSGAQDGQIKIWEMRRGLLVTNLDCHKGTIYSLSFSREGNLLATSCSECRLSIWDFTQLIDDLVPNVTGSKKENPDDENTENEESKYLLRTFSSKATPFFAMVFTSKNLLLTMGPYLAPTPINHQNSLQLQ